MFITIEGGDGSGKSTLMKRLESELKERGYEVVATREPGGTKVGEEVRELVLKHRHDHKMGQMAELLLFLTARVQHIEDVIQPALDAGKIVLCDRFNDSSVAYQGVGRGLGYEKVKHLCDEVCGGLVPDLTFFLDIDVETGIKRVGANGDRIEKERMDFHEKVREGYHRIAKDEPERFIVLDAEQDVATVFENAIQKIKV